MNQCKKGKFELLNEKSTLQSLCLVHMQCNYFIFWQ